MKVGGTCRICGQTHWMDLPITQDQISDWESGTLIQTAMPQLDDNQREFMISGSHQKCFEELFDE